MNTKHTAGPWKVGKKEPRETWCVWSGKLRIAWIDFWGEQIEAGNFKSEQEQQANARLIAAAPDMFNLIADAAFQLDRLSGENIQTYAKTFAALARAAISKAQGE